jgi:hypothetical protein
MMAGGNPDEERGRSDNDHYPTPPEVTQALVRKLGPWLLTKHVWEPCAGNGAMSDVLKLAVASIVTSDIVPLRADIQTLDFLEQKAMLGGSKVVITNPPFNLAEKIITHSFDIGATGLALVLKATYWHAKGRQALFQKHRPSIIMPLTWRPDFMGLGRPTMEVMWCVWATSCNPGAPMYIPLTKT